MTRFEVFSAREYENRRRQMLDQLNVDHAIIFNRSDLFYYSGTGLDGILYIDQGNITRYVRRNAELARDETDLQVGHMQSFRLFKELDATDINQLGLELDLLPYKTVEYIQNAFGQPEIVDIGADLRYIRSVKSDAEQEYMRQAAAQTDASFDHAEDILKPGMTEKEVSAEIGRFLRREGHPGYVNIRMFHHNYTALSYVMAGESTATLNSLFGPVSGQGSCRLHKNGPSDRKIKHDEAVLIDTTGVVEGYTADETRTFFLGNPPDILNEAYYVAKEVQTRSANLLQSGADPGEVYHTLQQLVTEMGMGNNFMGIADDTVPFVGHGIGLELDDLPIVTDRYDKKLETGNIIAMEPKFIFEQPKTGVGIEDSWIVGENGAERITNYPW